MIDERTEDDVLNLKDLLIDEKGDELSEYLSLSIENLGEDTRVTVTTVEECPTTYSSILSGESFINLQYLADTTTDSF